MSSFLTVLESAVNWHAPSYRPPVLPGTVACTYLAWFVWAICLETLSTSFLQQTLRVWETLGILAVRPFLSHERGKGLGAHRGRFLLDAPGAVWYDEPRVA